MVTGILSIPLSYVVGWVYKLLYYMTKFLAVIT